MLAAWAATEASPAAIPSGSVVCGAAINGTASAETRPIAAEKYPVIAPAFWPQYSAYSALVSAIGMAFCPRMLLASNPTSRPRLAMTTGCGTIISDAVACAAPAEATVSEAA